MTLSEHIPETYVFLCDRCGVTAESPVEVGIDGWEYEFEGGEDKDYCPKCSKERNEEKEVALTDHEH